MGMETVVNLKQGIDTLLEKKEFRLPSHIKNRVLRDFGDGGVHSALMGKAYDIQTIPLSEIELEPRESIRQRRASQWGDTPEKYDLPTLDLQYSYLNNPIRLRKADGKWKILDGNHRMWALKNKGYDLADVLVEREAKKK